jgi:hypothetical protein
MRTFGKSEGGGRRSAAREPFPFLAVLSTVTHNHHVVLEDISRDGARFSAPDLPLGEGEQLIFRADYLQAFGRVAWANNNECGVVFESPITLEAVEQLRRDAKINSGMPLSPEERARIDWKSAVPS